MRTGLAEQLWSRVCELPRTSSKRLFGLHCLAECHAINKTYEKALRMSQDVYYVMRDCYGEDHPQTLLALHQVANISCTCACITRRSRCSAKYIAQASSRSETSTFARATAVPLVTEILAFIHDYFSDYIKLI
jgi:hypothetical protein